MRPLLALCIAVLSVALFGVPSLALGITSDDPMPSVGGLDASLRLVSSSTRPIPSGFQFKPATYRLKWDPEFAYSSELRQDVLIDDETRAKIKGTPEFASEKPQYAALRVDGAGPEGIVAVAFDESQGTGKGYDTAYVDANRNWDLSDDASARVAFAPPMFMEKSLEILSLSYAGEPLPVPAGDWIRIKSRQGPADGWHANHEIQIRLRSGIAYYDDWDSSIPLLGLQRAGYARGPLGPIEMDKKGAWKAEVRFADQSVEVALTDANNNGIYGERTQKADGFPNMSTGDPFVVNGVHLRLTDVTWIAGNSYVIKPNCMGNLVSIRPYTGSRGTLAVQVPKRIHGLNAVVSGLRLTGSPIGPMPLSGAEQELPPGTYKVDAFVVKLSKDGSSGVELDCRPVKEFRAEVKPGCRVSLPVGSDLSAEIRTDASQIACKLDEWVRFDFVPTLGEGVAVDSIRGPSSSPRMEFLDSTGKVALTTTAGRT